jgi:hypothetical protein
MRARTIRTLLQALVALVASCLAAPAHSQDMPEYRLKAAFLYNFAVFTEWPAQIGGTLNLCIYGSDPFGTEIEPLNGKKVADRSLAVQRKTQLQALKSCQIVFLAAAESAQLQRVLESVRGLAVLTVTEAPGAVRQGAALNMSVSQGRVSFEANPAAARASQLELSSRLLRLATEVVQ